MKTFKYSVFVLCALLCGGCTHSPVIGADPYTRNPILDRFATEYSGAIAEADRDLPGDEWSAPPLRQNASRGRRVSLIASNVLSKIEPELKQMSVSNLVLSLKVFDGTGFTTNYIGDALYPRGNKLIIAEIASRPRTEREVLSHWSHDPADLDTGSNGEHYPMDMLIKHLAPEVK